MFTNKEEKEILEYIRNQRSEIGQIAEFMYHNTLSQCTFSQERSLGICRAIGISPDSGATVIIGELINMYKQIHGNDYEPVLYKKRNDD